MTFSSLAKHQTKRPFARALVLLTFITFMTLCYHQYGMRQYTSLMELGGKYIMEINDNEFNISDDSVSRGYVVWNSYCHIPNISAIHPSIANIVQPWRELICSYKPLLTKLVYDDNKAEVRIEIIPDAIKSHFGYTKKITCCYRTVTRPWLSKKIKDSDDDVYRLGPNECFHDNIVLSKSVEFVLVNCSMTGNINVYATLHAVVVDKEPHVNASKGEETKYNFIIFGIDSISRLNMARSMPLTKSFLEQNEWAHLEGYNKIGENTFPNVVALLTGRSYDQLVRHCFKDNNVPLDGCPFIWKNFSDAGYLTSYVEDQVDIGTFNYHKYGFTNPPTDYYTRPYVMAGLRKLPLKVDGDMDYCMGERRQADYLLEYAANFIQRMQHRLYFKLLWFNSFSHNKMNQVSVMDKRIRQMMEDIQPYLNSTFVIFLSDHGARFGKIRETYVGWLEERLPYIYFWIPPSYREKYPEKYSNLLANKNRLTTPYDVHLTIQEILYGTVMEPSLACPNCNSLFEKVDWNRSCESVAIPSHWCTCSSGKENKKKVEFPKVMMAIAEALQLMNGYILNYRNHVAKDKKCVSLGLNKVLTVRTITRRGKNSIFSEEPLYVIVFQVNPSQGIFEITWSPGIRLEIHEVSRINMYGDQSNCVLGDNDLKRICYCIEDK